MKANNKTNLNNLSVQAYINSIKNRKRKEDIQILCSFIEDTLKTEPKMWGTSIIGFGTHHYKYDSGRGGDTMAVGISARTNAIAMYGVSDNNSELLKKLGIKHDAKGCVYVNNVNELDKKILGQIIHSTYKARHNT